MGDRAHPRHGDGGPRGPAAVRNVALVGPSGAGKTALVEALALTAGATGRPGCPGDGGAPDHEGSGHRRRRSVRLALTPVTWDGVRINLLDTPGYADFTGELRAGLRAADAALFVVPASDGLDGTAPALWEECAAAGTPRAVVVTRPGSGRGGFEETARLCAEAFGAGDPDAVLPLVLPLRGPAAADGHAPVTGLAGALSRTWADHSSGRRVEIPPDPDLVPALEDARARLIEGIIAESEDESLMDRYLGGGEIEDGILLRDLERAVARGALFPVLMAAGDARQELGAVEILELIVHGFPSPLERPVPPVTAPDGTPRPTPACDPGATLAAEVVGTSDDPYAGRISLVRVFSGTLRADREVHVGGHGRDGGDHGADERAAAPPAPRGGRRPGGRVIAGDLGLVARLDTAGTGDTLSDPEDPLLIAPWEPPDPLLPVALEAHGGPDEERLSRGLALLTAEDPALRLEHDPDTRQVVLWCLGEAHAEVALERLRDRHRVRVDVVPHRVALRETFAAPATGTGRHVKQSGGHGQYAVCGIGVEPLPGGSGVEFADRVVGGAVPRQFVASVEKGVRAQAARDLGSGHPLTDVRVTLRDGRAHAVDSSDAAFQAAGALALREAAAGTGLRLLEPVAEVRVLAGDDLVGAVLTDLSARRGRVLGTEQAAGGRTRVRAEVPEVELDRYAAELRSLSHGTARFERRRARYEPVPERVARRMRGAGREEP
ncbi:elongation factor G-like protein EF-G2 [Streptomyces sp. SID8352]|uniref:elongation factor G-like protein EF-G2 n=1 Tax=Streptomyces sp. SID8352 TaxID=2690338 RepID=UPI001371DA40|nr:elongation factor G-like protein EF-G2 [Streptomyces sp. SID8352]MYU24574.1 elongation factor G-like protein EF-G2 [Streptomyces sp. SID8352]